MSHRPLRYLRIGLHYLVVIAATAAATKLFLTWQDRKAQLDIASEIIALCDLPDLPDDLVVPFATIVDSADPTYIDLTMTVIGSQETLNHWLEDVDEWKKKRPGKVLNYLLRESENSPRIDFSAEVYRPE